MDVACKTGDNDASVRQIIPDNCNLQVDNNNSTKFKGEVVDLDFIRINWFKLYVYEKNNTSVRK